MAKTQSPPSGHSCPLVGKAGGERPREAGTGQGDSRARAQQQGSRAMPLSPGPAPSPSPRFLPGLHPHPIGLLVTPCLKPSCASQWPWDKACSLASKARPAGPAPPASHSVLPHRSHAELPRSSGPWRPLRPWLSAQLPLLSPLPGSPPPSHHSHLSARWPPAASLATPSRVYPPLTPLSCRCVAPRARLCPRQPGSPWLTGVGHLKGCSSRSRSLPSSSPLLRPVTQSHARPPVAPLSRRVVSRRLS